MFDRFIELLLTIPNSVPILLGADPENAALVRTLGTLFLIVLVVYLMAMRPFRGIIAHFTGKSDAEKKQGKTEG